MTWPVSFLLAAVVGVQGALVWHGSLSAHALTASTSAIVGFIVGRVYQRNGGASSG